MNNCNMATNNSSTIQIKHVYGNVLRIAIPLTQIIHTMVNGEEQTVEEEFYPSPDYPVIVDLYKGGGLHKSFVATMEGNVATMEDDGTTPLGTYQVEVKCHDTNGKPCRYMVRAVIIIVDATSDAGIQAGVEFDVQTYTLNGTVYYYAKGEDGVGIASVEQIETSTENGGVNVIRVTLTNGIYTDFEVRNGTLSQTDIAKLSHLDDSNGDTPTWANKENWRYYLTVVAAALDTHIIFGHYRNDSYDPNTFSHEVCFQSHQGREVVTQYLLADDGNIYYRQGHVVTRPNARPREIGQFDEDWQPMGFGGNPEPIRTKWRDLVLKAQNGELTSGQLYRITDYVTTTKLQHTYAAGHQYDIIIQALDEYHFDENVHLVNHEETLDTTFFANNNIDIHTFDAKYSLYNNTGRFAWAWQEGDTEDDYNPADFADMLGDVNYFNIHGADVYFPVEWEQAQQSGEPFGFYFTQPSHPRPTGADGYVYYGVSSDGGGSASSDYGIWVNPNDFMPGARCIMVQGLDATHTATYAIISTINEQDNGSGSGYGRGVIYYMRDRFGNEAGYDFINIIFERDNYFRATFEANVENYYIYDCVIKDFYDETTKKYTLGFNLFIGSHLNAIYLDNEVFGTTINGNYVNDVSIGKHCSNIQIDNHCNDITIGSMCEGITVNHHCYDVTFGHTNNAITIGANSHAISLGDLCDNIIFGTYCSSISLGNNVYDCNFGTENEDIVVGNDCHDFTFAQRCCYISTGSHCGILTFGEFCNYINIGNSGYNITLGSRCETISCGQKCSSINVAQSGTTITFGDRAYNITLITPYTSDIIVETGSRAITLGTSLTTSSNLHLRFITLASGLNTSYTIVKTISHPTVGDTFRTVYKAVGSQEVVVS